MLINMLVDDGKLLMVCQLNAQLAINNSGLLTAILKKNKDLSFN